VTDQERIAQLAEEYHQLAHAMQSGVAAEMNHHPQPTEPKHLRTGINSSLVNSSALGKLLIDKGLITELEYIQAIRDGMAEEVQRYEQRLSEHYGRPVHLG